jgi:ABC-type nickel/cobalt efflux system permease component RcnA
MKSLELTSSSDWANWLIFLGVVLAVGLGIGAFVFWTMMFGSSSGKHHHKHHKHRKRRRHQRQHNPTLAQAGGLPPKRAEDQVSPGL